MKHGEPGHQSEARLQYEIRLALGLEPDVCIWRNSVGVAKHPDTRGRIRAQRFGLAVGSADLVGILAPSGRFFALEVKTEEGRLSGDQTLWLALVRKRGGFAAVVRSVEDAKAALDRARRGASE